MKIRPCTTPFLLHVLAVTACAGGAGTAPTEATPLMPQAHEAPEPIDLLLDHLHIESIVAPRGRAFTRQAALLIGDLSDEELERLVSAVQEGFEAGRLRGDVTAYMLEQAPEGFIEEIARWVESGASADVDRQASAYEPPVPLEEWLDTYTEEPPSAERVRLVARWSEARQEGTFFLLLEQALDEASHEVWGALRNNAPDFDSLSGDALFARLNQSAMAAVVTALHAHEPVSDEVMRASAVEYESEAGQWFVETYQIAVAEAVRAAGDRVAETLRRSPVSAPQ